jgi:CRP/FNR family cyclic AMP-dependent transcriptional regulator
MGGVPGRSDSVDRLRGVKEFSGGADVELAQVAELAEHVHVLAGEILTKEGRIDREFFLILSGAVSVTQKGRQVNLLGPGEFFGELAAVHPGPRNATVTAITDLEVLIIGSRELSTISEIPSFREALLQGMARKLRAADASLAEIAEAGALIPRGQPVR